MMEHNQQRQLQTKQITCEGIQPHHDVVVIRTLDALGTLAPDWQSLHRRDGRHELCMSYTWIATWLSVYLQPNDELYILAVYQQAQLAFLAPFYVQHTNLNTGRNHTLYLIGNGEAEQDEVVSEFQDCLLDNKLLTQADALSLLTHHLSAQTTWRYLEFRYCACDALIYRWSQQQRKAFLTVRLAGIRYISELSHDWHTTLRAFPSKNGQQRMQKALNRLAKHPLTVEKASTRAQLTEQFEQLTQLHQQRWQARGSAGAFASAAFCQFHHALTEHALEQGELALYQLYHTHDETPIAAIYCLTQANRRYYYQSGFDLQYASLSPVTLLHAIQIQDAIAAKQNHYDWMCGTTDSYKKSYATQQEPVYHGVLFRANAHNPLSIWIEKLKAWKRQIKVRR